jgi:hypothetical protein
MIKFKTDPVIAAGYFLIIILCIFPFFIDLPFRPNIYLSWEGAYRISNGEMPFRDFGMPLGVGFWILPASFFAIFGPYFKVLVLVQSLVNIISIFVVRGILKSFQLNQYLIFLLILVFYSSMVMPNYWPWYNHMAVFYQLISIYFLLKGIQSEFNFSQLINLNLSAAFGTLAVFTKQDIGFLSLITNMIIVVVYSINSKKWQSGFWYSATIFLIALINILPFIRYEFSYWFNYGQFPHHARVTVKDLAHEFITGSQWIKFYLLVIFIILVRKGYFNVSVKENLPNISLALLTLGILAQAAIIQFTSFNPPDGNIFFHVFALAFILSNVELKIDLSKRILFLPLIVLTLSWWSFNYWKYANKVFDKILPEEKTQKEYSVSKYTWEVKTDTIKAIPYEMYPSDFAVLKGITIPKQTNEGIHLIKALDIVNKKGADLKVLNLSELTFLPYELGYNTIKGPNIPLWHHLTVAFFDREINMYCDKIDNQEFDLILFQDVNNSNNYFPYAVKDCVEKRYQKRFTFLGPKGFAGNYIHVYTKSN